MPDDVKRPPALDVALSVKRLRDGFEARDPQSAAPRLAALHALANMLTAEEEAILVALKADLGKPQAEALSGEIGFLLSEIKYTTKRLKRWMRPDRKPTPIIALPGASSVVAEPLGVVMVIGTWNYPIQTLFGPAIGALAAGNSVVLKPSEIAPHTSALAASLTEKYFSDDVMLALEGGPDVVEAVMGANIDHVFFTGSTNVGRKVMARVAETLTPVTLELGGKCPAIVDETADLDVAARRIAWGRFMNAGQLCVAPDHVYVHESRRDAFVEALKTAIAVFYDGDPKSSADYGRIVSHRHFERLAGLLHNADIISGGGVDAAARYIEPTLVALADEDHPLMQEEIFGPILPVLTYNDIDKLVSKIARKPKPLACYPFTASKETADKVVYGVPSGAACVNDVVLYQTVPGLPFGGVGDSGMGAFHGKHGFDAFSHRKAVLRRPTILDAAMRYPPFTEGKLKMLRKLM